MDSVYIATSGGKTKVGVARHVGSRLAQIQSTCPTPVRLVYSSESLAGLRPRTIEARVWYLLAERWSHGEWFHGEVGRDRATQLIAEAIALDPRRYSAHGNGHGRREKMMQICAERGVSPAPNFGVL